MKKIILLLLACLFCGWQATRAQQIELPIEESPFDCLLAVGIEPNSTYSHQLKYWSDRSYCNNQHGIYIYLNVPMKLEIICSGISGKNAREYGVILHDSNRMPILKMPGDSEYDLLPDSYYLIITKQRLTIPIDPILPLASPAAATTYAASEPDYAATVTIRSTATGTPVKDWTECYFDSESSPVNWANASIEPNNQLGGNSDLLLNRFAHNYVAHFVSHNGSKTSGNLTMQYFDGIGRSTQTVKAGASGSGQADLVSLQEYDGFSRQSNTWLPAVVAAGNGNPVSPETLKSKTRTSYDGDLKPYAMPQYEASPLNRVQRQYGPGNQWHEAGRTVNTQYLTNAAGNDTLNCIHYTATDESTQNLTQKLVHMGNYATGKLQVTWTRDEDGHVSMEFTDKQNRVLLTRKLEHKDGQTIPHDTYYIYDDLDNLKMVLPPMASDNFHLQSTWYSNTSTPLLQYAYLYKYDSRKRLIAKKLPGAEWTYYIYDESDRLIFTQDGNRRTASEWTFTIADGLGRPCLMGTCINLMDVFANPLQGKLVRAEWKNETNSYKGYALSDTELIFPTIQSVNYYNSYAFIGKNSVPTSLTYITLTDYNTRQESVEKGLPTGTIIAQTNSEGVVGNYLYSAVYYDNRGRVVQNRATNHLGGLDEEYIACNYIGQPTKRKLVHSATGKSPQAQAYRYVYDHAGRLTHTYYKYDTNPEFLLAQQQYDELGRLQTKKQHGSAIDPTVYAYNIRGWVKEITNNRFTQNLYYNTGYGTPCYNGNISSMTWKAGTESTVRGYKFIYDKLSRLSEANYGEGTTITANSNRSFSEIVTAYDKHGNMQGLKRYGNTGSSNKLIDDLSFGYMGNQLKYVNDAIAETSVSQSFHFMDKSKSTGNEFTYDRNGNMVTDNNKNITRIQYNILNLPRKVQLSTGRLVKYTYDAAGIKRNVTHQGAGVNKSTDYCGTVIYENGILNKILTEEGYITFVGTTPTYHYYLKDHLGNNRIVLHQNGSTVEQVNHYYPFGGLFDQTAETLQTYKYNGKELDRTYDIDLYDYSARYMDGALGRFTTMDPMAEKYYGISPYAYCANNPMRYVDPTGMEPEDDGMWTKLGHFLKDLFSIKIDTSSEEAGAKTSERYNQQLETIENITEGVETFNTTAAMIMPASSVVELSAAVFAGASAETIGVAAVSVAVDVVTGGKGKAVTQFISLSDIKRIENAASKIGKTINVVGSRAVPGKVENGINVAKGTPADWDYVIEGMTNKEWKKIKNSLPGAKSNIDNTPRNIDVFDKLDKSKPYIPIHPKNK